MANSVKRMASFLSTDKNRQCAQLEELVGLVESESECIGCNAARPEAPPWISTRTIAIGALLVGLFLPAVIPLGDVIGLARAFRGPAVGFHDVTLLIPVIRVGEPFIIRTKSQYLRTCAWHWTLEWRRAEGNRPIAIESHFGSAHVVGEMTQHDIAFSLPVGIKPGKYIYHESAQGECGSGDVAQIIDPDLVFTVID